MIRILLTAGDIPADTALRQQLRLYQIQAVFCAPSGSLLLQRLRQEHYDAFVMRHPLSDLTPGALRGIYESSCSNTPLPPVLPRPKTLFFAVLRGPDSMQRQQLLHSGYAAVLTLPMSEYTLAHTVLEYIGQMQEGYRDAQDELRQLYAQQLLELGMPAHIKGFSYAAECLVYLASHPDALYQVTKELYPQVALRKGTSASNLERAIRTAVEKMWEQGDPNLLASLFPTGERPSNKELLAVLYQRALLRRQA